MKRYSPNGGHIKELRTSRERNAGQKQFAHEVRISERKLRLIENENAPVTADALERIAKALGVPRQALVLEPGRPPATAEPQRSAPGLSPPPAPKLVPRFDTQSATVARDESDLFDTARSSHLVISHFATRLTPETRSYAEEMLDLLESVSWDRRDPLKPIPGSEELRIRGRLQELLVLLKGNDVWVYELAHIKKLPESDVLVAEGEARKLQMQAIVAFGPPGEYGEDSVPVPVDNGQPWLYDPGETYSPVKPPKLGTSRPE